MSAPKGGGGYLKQDSSKCNSVTGIQVHVNTARLGFGKESKDTTKVFPIRV